MDYLRLLSVQCPQWYNLCLCTLKACILMSLSNGDRFVTGLFYFCMKLFILKVYCHADICISGTFTLQQCITISSFDNECLIRYFRILH